MNEQNNTRNYKRWLTIVSVILAAVLCVQGVYMAGGFGKPKPQTAEQEQKPEETAVQSEAAESAATADAAGAADAADAASDEGPAFPTVMQAAEVPGSLSHEGYTLEQVLVFSRHNIRSPLKGNREMMATVTPHEWFEWSSDSSELSVRGGDMEVHVGQFFRKWLEEEGLFPTNYHPEEGAVRIYANSKQRTIATAQFFDSGILPTANIPVEYYGTFGDHNPVFHTKLTFCSDSYSDAVKKQIDEVYGSQISALADNYDLLADVADIEASEAFKSGEFTGFSVDDTEMTYENEKEPSMKGSLKTACAVADAMILQLYEMADASEAAFGNNLTFEQWKELSEIKDLYNDIMFATPLVAYNVANPLLKLMRSELTEEGRQFTLLCGHDANIASFLTCLRTKEYDLPATVETRTPIGGKVVFSRWRSPDGGEMMSVDLVYASTEQLRDLSVLDLKNHPVIVPLSLEGLEKNADGLYKAEDVLQRFDEAISEYDRIVEEYSEDGAEESDEPALDEAA